MRPLAFAFLAALTSCSGSEPGASPVDEDANAADTFAPGDDTNAAEETATVDSTSPSDVGSDAFVFGPYPAGPYGNKVGDVVANLAWEGHVSLLADGLANTKPYVTTSMDQLRRDAKKGYALIHVSEFY